MTGSLVEIRDPFLGDVDRLQILGAVQLPRVDCGQAV